jgi:hypothetical protein
MPNTYVALATQTLGTATNTLTFSLSGISGYTDLRVVIDAAVTSSADNVCFRYNSDTGSNYSRTGMAGNGSSALSARSSNVTFNEIDYYGYLETTRSVIYADIMNYSNSTTFKTVLGRSSNAANGTGATVGLWRNTAAITSLTIFTKASINFAVGSTFSLYGIANADQGSAKATGGIITEDSQYWYHTFGASGVFTPKQALTCDYLVVAGGGAGGNYGGGGAGGLRSTVTATGGGGALESQLSLLSATNYTVTVGAGGSGAVQNNPTNGSNSVFSTITSTGGGRGSFNINGVGPTNPNAGGSGGGGIWNGGAGGAASPSGQGFAGGAGHVNNSSPFAAGGGGGAGAAGQAGQATVGGNGGNGVATVISGTSVTYAGGGGGGHFNGTGSNSSGGSGGGGNGGKADVGETAGTANTGGGGGGSGTSDAIGTNGGSGIVIVRYAK